MERIWLKSYPEGVPADVNPTAYASIGDFFAANADRYRDRTAYVCMGRTMTYGELDRLSRSFAGYLQHVASLPRGARVALMMPNLLQYPVALFGALRAGYVVVNCNPLYSPRELHHQLHDSGAEAIVVLENFAQTLEKAIDATQVRVVVVAAVGDLLGGARRLLINFLLRHIRHAVPSASAVKFAFGPNGDGENSTPPRAGRLGRFRRSRRWRARDVAPVHHPLRLSIRKSARRATPTRQ